MSSARNYYTWQQLMDDAAYWRRQEKVYRDRAWARKANIASLRAQASEDIMVRQIEQQLQRVKR